jgi:hypothetical protein
MDSVIGYDFKWSRTGPQGHSLDDAEPLSLVILFV